EIIRQCGYGVDLRCQSRVFRKSARIGMQLETSSAKKFMPQIFQLGAHNSSTTTTMALRGDSRARGGFRGGDRGRGSFGGRGGGKFKSPRTRFPCAEFD